MESEEDRERVFVVDALSKLDNLALGNLDNPNNTAPKDKVWTLLSVHYHLMNLRGTAGLDGAIYINLASLIHI